MRSIFLSGEQRNRKKEQRDDVSKREEKCVLFFFLGRGGGGRGFLEFINANAKNDVELTIDEKKNENALEEGIHVEQGFVEGKTAILVTHFSLSLSPFRLTKDQVSIFSFPSPPPLLPRFSSQTKNLREIVELISIKRVAHLLAQFVARGEAFLKVRPQNSPFRS